jgi:hypothetical protein
MGHRRVLVTLQEAIGEYLFSKKIDNIEKETIMKANMLSTFITI